MLFSDSLALGEEASRITGLPFIFGEHTLKERIEALDNNKRFVCIRIFDEGMDMPDVKIIRLSEMVNSGYVTKDVRFDSESLQEAKHKEPTTIYRITTLGIHWLNNTIDKKQLGPEGCK